MRCHTIRVIALWVLMVGGVFATVPSASAEMLRLGFWPSELSRKGPGLLLRDILRGKEPQALAAIAAIDRLDADVLVLGHIDFDAGNVTLSALNGTLARPYPYIKALRPNRGVPSGFDLDGNGRNDEARDAWGYGFFPGQRGMAILSRFPILPQESRDFTSFLWQNLPEDMMPPDTAPEVRAAMPLSSSGHHDTALELPDGRVLNLLSWHGSTPAFDGPEDRNGRRNHDETAFWQRLLDGELPFAAPENPFVLLGQANSDPQKGDGDGAAIRGLLKDTRLQNVLSGDSVNYGGSIGPLRVSYILPSIDLEVEAGGLNPAPEGARHRLLWIEIDTTPEAAPEVSDLSIRADEDNAP